MGVDSKEDENIDTLSMLLGIAYKKHADTTHTATTAKNKMKKSLKNKVSWVILYMEIFAQIPSIILVIC